MGKTTAQQYTVNIVSGEKDEAGTLTSSSRCYRIQTFLSRASHLLSTHLGLVCILVIYSFIGAAIFQAVEEPAEIQRLKQRDANVVKGEELLTNWTRQAAILGDEGEIQTFLLQMFREYEDEIKAVLDNTTQTLSERHEWDLWGSLLFCATVYTTIGYGHIAPTTSLGRVICIVYAVIGIPLCLVALANLGRLLTKALKFLWSFIRRFYYTGRCRNIRKSMPGRAMAFRLSIEDKLDIRSNRPDSWVQPHQPCLVRFRSLVRRNFRRLWNAVWNFITCQNATAKVDATGKSGTPNGGTDNGGVENGGADNGGVENGGADNGGVENGGVDNAETTETGRDHVGDVQSRADEEDGRSVMAEFLVDDEFNLPPLIAIIILFTYNFFGAAMYTIWESWSFLDSFYFIFISVSTIGFGDVLPAHPNYFLASSVYIIIGLSLVAMVVNVIMVAVHDALRRAKTRAMDTLDKAKDHLDSHIDQVKDTLDRAKDKVRDVSSKMKEGLSFSCDSIDKVGRDDKNAIKMKRKLSLDNL